MPLLIHKVSKRVVRQKIKALMVAKKLEPVFTISIGRFDDIKARIQGKKRSKVEYLASIFNAVAAFLGHKRCPWK